MNDIQFKSDEDQLKVDRRAENFYGIGRSIILAFLLVVSIAFAFYVYQKKDFSKDTDRQKVVSPDNNAVAGMVKFKSREDFLNYLESSNLNVGTVMPDSKSSNLVLEKQPESGGSKDLCGDNVDVEASSLDNPLANEEPGGLKISGGKAYYLRDFEKLTTSADKNNKIYNSEVEIIDTSLPQKIKKIGSIGENRRFLVDGDILVAVSENNLAGYNVKNSRNFGKIWNFDIGEENEILSSRFYDHKIYLVVKSQINTKTPCPISLNDTLGAIISCSDIYHPENSVPVDSVFTILTLDQNGSLITRVSFVGTSEFSYVYLGSANIYFTYFYYLDPISFLSGFFDDDGSEIISEDVKVKIKEIRREKIDLQNKMSKLEAILGDYFKKLSVDKLQTTKTKFSEKLNLYSQKHVRDMQKSGLVKISAKDLSILARGDFPGKPRDKFSFNEDNSYLRIISSIRGVSAGNSEVDDIYILDRDLDMSGQFLDLNSGNRICSLFYLGQRIVVSTGANSPSLILDLSDPKNPRKGEEMNFSGFVYPLFNNDNQALIILQDGKNTKVSLFDLSNANYPKEISHISLNEPWKEIKAELNNILLDSNHQAIFLPAGQNSYIFTYDNNTVMLSKKLSGDFKRAASIGDYFYLFSRKGVTVFGIKDWQEVNKLLF